MPGAMATAFNCESPGSSAGVALRSHDAWDPTMGRFEDVGLESFDHSLGAKNRLPSPEPSTMNVSRCQTVLRSRCGFSMLQQQEWEERRAKAKVLGALGK